ncbi:MAG TPA: recombinase RecD [Desulfobulbus sp.]|nr:recombinase RecD [Desulfobulbus sp.]
MVEEVEVPALAIEEKIRGIVERITYHNADSGWSVIKVTPFNGYGELVTVTVHQMRVFAGATMEFAGNWTVHPRFGRQFKAIRATELRPATAGALEKYLGSGLIKGVGPKTARKIVRHFGSDTLDIFEHHIDRLVEVPGIAEKKLTSIKKAWSEHRAIRDVMIFLQSHGLSTLFAVRIYKQYGDNAIALVTENPYRLAVDFYGIGFFSADKIARSIGFAENAPLRIRAGIRHVLSASREQGHCYLMLEQIKIKVAELLQFDPGNMLEELLVDMAANRELCERDLQAEDGTIAHCYYSRSLYYDEEYVARRVAGQCGKTAVDEERAARWLLRYGSKSALQLSRQQQRSLLGIVGQRCAVLTGGPGCGKTTITRVLVSLMQAMGRSVLLAAPTGRAAQRMTEVIGLEAGTIHRLLEYQGRDFKRNEENPLQTDMLIVDECSMLDISLSASLLKAVSRETMILFIGDADQLPSVGAGNVLLDIINSGVVPCFHLTEIFRQAGQSQIIACAHLINSGQVPRIGSPFKDPDLWKSSDCFFMDAEEATLRQLQVIARIKKHYATVEEREQAAGGDPYSYTEHPYDDEPLQLPEAFRHVSGQAVVTADSAAGELAAVLKKIHPWSALYYGLTAAGVIRELYATWIPRYCKGAEIQVLSPMIRGSLGTARLNTMIQATVNPAARGRAELALGEKIFRVGDRVIHRRNNYDLEVFNGDIGTIVAVDNNDLKLRVSFLPDHRQVEYQREQITELEHAFAITVHKAQGSEFEVVILPVVSQHYRMLFRNLIYTGLTRARRLAIFVGTRRAFAMAVHNKDTSERQTALAALIRQFS